MPPKFQFSDYDTEYKQFEPDDLRQRAESGYTDTEKAHMFGARSASTIADVLKGMRHTRAASSAGGISGGFTQRAMSEVEDAGALALEGIRGSVEDESMRLQQDTMSQLL